MIRTREPSERLSTEDSVRSSQRLSLMEGRFRCLEGLDLLVRPIHHRLEPRVRAPRLICMPASSVEWHLRQAWKPLLFEAEELEQDRGRRDPVAAAQPSASVRREEAKRETEGRLPGHSFRTLLAHLGTRCRDTCQVISDPSGTTSQQVTELDPVQREAPCLLEK